MRTAIPSISYYQKLSIVSGFLLSLILALVWHTDYALQLIWEYGKADYLPYGPVWFVLNPYWWTDRLYMIWLFVVQSIMTFIYWKLVRRGLLSWRVLFLWQITNAYLIFTGGPQNITVNMFAPLIFLSPAFALWVFIKVPMPGTLHWECAFGNTGIVVGIYNVPCSHFSENYLAYIFNYPIMFYNFFLYAVLAVWQGIPILLWLEKRLRKKFLILNLARRILNWFTNWKHLMLALYPLLAIQTAIFMLALQFKGIPYLNYWFIFWNLFDYGIFFILTSWIAYLVNKLGNDA